MHKTISYYDVLNICPTATTATIKDAYHTLIKQYHPDRRNQYDSAIDTNANNYHSETHPSDRDFVQIQTAWECLRDPITRLSYDDQLYQKQQQHNMRRRQRQQNSIPITIDECRQERQFVETDNENDSDDACLGESHNETMVVVDYIYQCRCGHDLYVAQQQQPSHMSTIGSYSETEQQPLLLIPYDNTTTILDDDEDGSIDYDDMFLHCVGCSVVYDIRPVFRNELDNGGGDR